MAACFPPAPVNPVNEVLLGAFGDNFFPPYAPQFQPTNRGDMVNETLLQLVIPGTGKVKPIGEPDQKHISEILSPITGALGTVFAMFAPLYIILDLIRAIIDIICAFFNPTPVITSIVDLMITVIPGVIGLYPPLSSILHAINAAKVITATVVSLLSAVIPIIDLIVRNALSIVDIIADGNIDAVEAVLQKVCILLETFANELGGLAPLSFILEMLDLFTSLGSKLFCPADDECCDTEACPPIILDPPSGNAQVIAVGGGLTLLDILGPLKAIPIHELLPFPPVTEEILFIEETEIPLEAVGDVFNQVAELIDDLLVQLSVFSGGLVTLPEDTTSFLTDVGEQLSEITIPRIAIGPFPEFLDLLPFVSSEDLEGFVIIPRSFTIEILDVPNLADLPNFIVSPDKIPGAQSTFDPATIRLVIFEVVYPPGAELGPTTDPTTTTLTRSDDISLAEYQAIIADGKFTQFDQVWFDFAVVSGTAKSVTAQPKIGEDVQEDGSSQERARFFEVASVVAGGSGPLDCTYAIIPDIDTLLQLALISLGCQEDIRDAADAVGELVRETSAGIEATTGGEDRSGFEPLDDKVGRKFPPLPTDLDECLQRQTADPTISQSDCVTDIITEYIDDVKDYALDVLCVGVSRVQSDFEVTQSFVDADGKDFSTITLIVRDAGRNNLLQDFLPNATVPEDFSAVFNTDLGTIGPVIFDRELAVFRANITSEKEGVANISGAFLIKGKVCMIPGKFEELQVTDKILNVTFQPPGGSFPRRRRQNTYVQSAGGRRR